MNIVSGSLLLTAMTFVFSVIGQNNFQALSTQAIHKRQIQLAELLPTRRAKERALKAFGEEALEASRIIPIDNPCIAITSIDINAVPEHIAQDLRYEQTELSGELTNLCDTDIGTTNLQLTLSPRTSPNQTLETASILVTHLPKKETREWILFLNTQLTTKNASQYSITGSSQ